MIKEWEKAVSKECDTLNLRQNIIQSQNNDIEHGNYIGQKSPIHQKDINLYVLNNRECKNY